MSIERLGFYHILGHYIDNDNGVIRFAGFFKHISRLGEIRGLVYDCDADAEINGIYLPGKVLNFSKRYGGTLQGIPDIEYKLRFCNNIWEGTYCLTEKDGTQTIKPTTCQVIESDQLLHENSVPRYGNWFGNSRVKR